jgi:hypothetical protein
MIPHVPLREALFDPNLLGTAIAGDSWRSWRTLLIAAMGEELREDTSLDSRRGADARMAQSCQKFLKRVGASSV